MTGVMVLAKAFVDARIPRPPSKSASKPKKKKQGSLKESLQASAAGPFPPNTLYFLFAARVGMIWGASASFLWDSHKSGSCVCHWVPMPLAWMSAQSTVPAQLLVMPCRR